LKATHCFRETDSLKIISGEKVLTLLIKKISMERELLRGEIHHYVDQADEHVLILMYGMISYTAPFF
jgi:hypothetical protein